MRLRPSLAFVLILPHLFTCTTIYSLISLCSQITMTDFEFNDRIDKLMVAIEDAIEECEVDIDCENAGGILTLTFDNRSQIILSRQSALKQLWVAARSGGFYLNFEAVQQHWACDGNGEELAVLLNRCMSDQAGEEIEFDLG